MTSYLSATRGQPAWITLTLLVFAAAFLVVGILRVVEFGGIGLGGGVRRALIAAHVLGCLLFSSALAVMALDAHQAYRKETNALLLFALAILFPVHIFIAIKRRIRIRDSRGL